MSLIQIPPQKKRWISLTPLIDVVFILLMFFMLTTQFERTSVLDVSVGGGSAKTLEKSNDTVQITVLGNGEWRIENEEEQTYSLIDDGSLAQIANAGDVKVFASNSATLQDVITMLDALADIDIKDVTWLSGDEAVSGSGDQ